MTRIVDCVFFFFNDTATTEIYTLSLHDALPIFVTRLRRLPRQQLYLHHDKSYYWSGNPVQDRKSTRLNSSHANISYAVFCLKKKISYPPHTLSIKSFLLTHTVYSPLHGSFTYIP